MMRKFIGYGILILLALLFTACVVAQTTRGFTGTLVAPDGTPFNGYLHIGLPAGGPTIRNLCSTPVQVVPKLTANYTAQNGVIVNGTSAHFTATDCLYPRVVYNVELDDINHNFLMNDNWYLPSSTDANYDVGTMAQENFGGPIIVAVPKGIISNPSVNQTIVQPAGTSLEIDGTLVINGTTFATAAGGITFPGVLQTTSATNQTVTQTGSSSLSINGTFYVNGVQLVSNTGTLLTGVTSFNTRTGAVVPASGDYTCAQVTNCLTKAYTTLQSNGTAQNQETNINFGTEFALTDVPASFATNVHLATTGVTAGTYTNPTSVGVNQYGQITSIAGGGSSATYVLYSWSFTGCSTTSSQPNNCASSFSLPINMPDSNYAIHCDVYANSYTTGSVNIQTLGAPLPTSAGSSITYRLLSVMSDGASGLTSPTIWCTIHHN